MQLLKKYMLFILLLANMTAEYKLLASISEVFFYTTLGLSILMFIIYARDFSAGLKKNPEISWLMVVYTVALLCFQMSFLSADNVLYTVAKVSVFGIITLSISSDYQYYLKRLPVIFSYIILVLIAVGWFVNKTAYNGDIVFGFSNRNVACTIATAGFAGFLFMRDRFRLSDYVIMAFLLITILYGGSRNALAMCVLIVVIRFGFSFKIVLAGALVLALITFLLPELGIEATAYERLVGTFDGSVSVDREEVRAVAIKMIAMRPWTGWGYNYSIPSYMDVVMNAHNGYLTMIVNLGYPCGLAALGIIIIGSIKRLWLYKVRNSALNYYLAILVATLFAANQEDYFIGVNQFTTNYFYVAFVILGMYKYYMPLKFYPHR